jgi:hypothetical protein
MSRLEGRVGEATIPGDGSLGNGEDLPLQIRQGFRHLAPYGGRPLGLESSMYTSAPGDNIPNRPFRSLRR